MRITEPVKKILAYYESDCPGTKANLCRILMHGRLGGTGRVIILPVDQGSEHGPAQSFAPNPAAYDPAYHFQLAIDASLNAFAAPLGMIESGASTFAGAVPLILKLNNANALAPKSQPKDQAVTGSVRDALRLGCAAVGLTIYPGAPKFTEISEEAREIIAEAKSLGLATVVWSYPRDSDFPPESETALDIVAYATHLAALLGSHIIKVKLPTDKIEQKSVSKLYEEIDRSSLASRVKHIMDTAFNGRRIVVFSGGGKKDDSSILTEAKAIRDGGGHGSIIGRNSFQRGHGDALALLDRVAKVYE
jgi:fructose-bisphosphate aldolase, class I